MGVVVNDGCSSPCFISTGTEERVMGGLEGKPPGSWMRRERDGWREEESEGHHHRERFTFSAWLCMSEKSHCWSREWQRWSDRQRDISWLQQ